MSPSDLPNQRQAKQQLQSAYNRWAAAWQEFGEYPERLRDLAAAADSQRKAAQLAALTDVEWVDSEPEVIELPPELQPGRRPGPAKLWVSFDAAFDELGEAWGGDGFHDLAGAFTKVAKATSQVADQLEALGITTVDDEGTGTARQATG